MLSLKDFYELECLSADLLSVTKGRIPVGRLRLSRSTPSLDWLKLSVYPPLLNVLG